MTENPDLVKRQNPQFVSGLLRCLPHCCKGCYAVVLGLFELLLIFDEHCSEKCHDESF